MKVRAVILSESEYELILSVLTAAANSRSEATSHRGSIALKTLTDAVYIANLEEKTVKPK